MNEVFKKIEFLLKSDCDMDMSIGFQTLISLLQDGIDEVRTEAKNFLLKWLNRANNYVKIYVIRKNTTKNYTKFNTINFICCIANLYFYIKDYHEPVEITENEFYEILEYLTIETFNRNVNNYNFQTQLEARSHAWIWANENKKEVTNDL